MKTYGTVAFRSSGGTDYKWRPVGLFLERRCTATGVESRCPDCRMGRKGYGGPDHSGRPLYHRPECLARQMAARQFWHGSLYHDKE